MSGRKYKASTRFFYLLFEHTSPIEPMLKKCAISNDIVTVLKCVESTLADINCYCKMTSVMALVSVM